MSKQIKGVFESECGDLKIDAKFIKKLVSLEKQFVNSNEDHIEFLGGVLLGTPPLRFVSHDRNIWFDEILETDDMVLKSELHSLPSIHAERNVSSDEFNLSVAWIVHAISNSPHLSGKQKEDGMIAALQYLHYRFLGSLMGHYFRYEPKRSAAETTYAALNHKFALKRAGSWAKLILWRCEDVISKTSIHRQTIENFNDDDQILYMVTDIQGRIREIVKNMVRLFYEIQEGGMTITSTSKSIEIDGVMQVKDLHRMSSAYKRYIHSTLSDRNTFIREELTAIIADAMHTMPERHLISVLEYMADNQGSRGDKAVDDLVDETLLHAFDFMQDRNNLSSKNVNLVEILSKLRSLYMSSRSSDRSLIKMRDLSLKITKKVVKSSNSSLLSSIRTGVMMYIVLRTFTMNYYKNLSAS